MGRPPNTPVRVALRQAKRTLARIEALDPRIHPKWHEKMLAFWRRRVAELREVDRADRTHTQSDTAK